MTTTIELKARLFSDASHVFALQVAQAEYPR
jgi:hypothetical protein